MINKAVQNAIYCDLALLYQHVAEIQLLFDTFEACHLINDYNLIYS